MGNSAEKHKYCEIELFWTINVWYSVVYGTINIEEMYVFCVKIWWCMCNMILLHVSVVHKM